MVERYSRTLADRIVSNDMHKGEHEKADICLILRSVVQKTVILSFLDVDFTRCILDLY
jgi:hypothetical protein